jgi:acyl-coenzyme A synthetase/AMP-(fatty) acid ligase
MSTPQPGFAGALPPERFNLARYCLERSARERGGKTALIVCESNCDLNRYTSWHYGPIEDLVLRIAQGFADLGFGKGERVFIRMGNSIDYALIFFAANAAGLVPVPASSQLSVREVGLLLEDCQPTALVADGSLPVPDLPPTVRQLDKTAIADLKRAPRGDYCYTHKDDPAFLIYTSGTTSRPKGVLHAQRAVWGRRPMYKDWYDISVDDCLLHMGAFNWTYTLGTGLFDPWANGATSMVYTGEKDITVWPRLIEKHRPSIIAGVPTLYRQMLKYCDMEKADLASLRHGLTAGEPIPLSVEQEWMRATGVGLYEALGMSEISTYISSPPDERANKAGSPGKPQRGRCVALLAEAGGTLPVHYGQQGVISVHRSDPGLMLGYWNRPKEEAAMIRGDWFITGDLAHMDEDGYVWFDGRHDDLMNAMGYRVSPVEVEACISAFGDVDQVGVTTVHVSETVEIITAFLVPVAGKTISVAALQAHCHENLAAYKVPKQFVVVEGLPKNASNKLLRKQLVKLPGRSL